MDIVLFTRPFTYARHQINLNQSILHSLDSQVQANPGGPRIGLILFLGYLEVDQGCDEPSLGTVMKFTLDLSPGLVCGRDEPCPRGDQLGTNRCIRHCGRNELAEPRDSQFRSTS